MGRKVRFVVDVTELGRKGGLARAANLTDKELRAAGKAAAMARWAQYYRDHPDKLRARQVREARRTGKVGRPAEGQGKEVSGNPASGNRAGATRRGRRDPGRAWHESTRA